MLIDTHTHLELEDFDRDRDEVIDRARKAGIEFMVTVGTTIGDCKKALSLASKYNEVYVAIGIHPHEVKKIDNRTYEDLRELARMDKVVAYGEIGLDFFRNLSPMELQIKRFGEQLELACEIGLPVIIHDREAHKETIEMLTARRGRVHGVVHCFSGDKAMAKKCLDLGFFISVPGTVTFNKAEVLKEVVKYTPLSSLLVETDAPFLAPVPQRGKRNESSFVVHTAAKVAEIKSISLQEIGDATSKNAKTLFIFDAGTKAGAS